jgi:endonuclease YncB( thermonuclease family)
LYARRELGRDYDRIVYAEGGLPTRAVYEAFVTKWSSRYPAVAWSLEEVEEQLAGVADGHTITILVAERPIKVRLAEIDTPERGQPWATRAKQALSDKVFRESVEVRVVDTDRYGRTVGHVWLGDRHINRELVRDGHGWKQCDPPIRLAQPAGRDQAPLAQVARRRDPAFGDTAVWCTRSRPGRSDMTAVMSSGAFTASTCLLVRDPSHG